MDTVVSLRARDVRHAFNLELFTIAYMVFEAIGALGIGIATQSVSLETFGADSLIEIVAAVVVATRLRIETRGAAAVHVERLEQRAEKFVGWSLLALAAYILIQSIAALFLRAQPTANIWGIALAVLALIVMPLLARFKLKYAERIDSGALRADAVESFACAYLSFTLLLGLGANYFFGWWWADPLAALAMLYFIVREAREALFGEHSEEEAKE